MGVGRNRNMKEVLIDTSEEHVAIVIAEGLIVKIFAKALTKKYGKPIHMKELKGTISVISPVPWAPRVLWFREKWKRYGKAETEKVKDGIRVYFPRFVAIPGRWFFPLEGFFMYFSIRRHIRKIMRSNRVHCSQSAS